MLSYSSETRLYIYIRDRQYKNCSFTRSFVPYELATVDRGDGGEERQHVFLAE